MLLHDLKVTMCATDPNHNQKLSIDLFDFYCR